MGELLAFLPVLIFFLVVISIVRAAAKVVRKTDQTTAPALPRTPADYDPGQAERTRRIQEEIRRKIAERRGLTTGTPQPVGPRMEPPQLFSEEPAAPLVEAPERADSAVQAAANAVLVRQQHLADQMRALETARTTVQRRAVQVSADVKTASLTRTALLTEERAILLEDVRDPMSLRRAFVLREVLGTPVGLR
jgi:hypothetical protein